MLTHPLICSHAAARNRPHRTICRAIGRLARAAGSTVDYERAIPELYEWEQDKPKPREAILDVVLTWPGALALQTVDVCISCPHADRTSAAWRRPALAATNAEKRKAARYGQSVMPLSFESHGRMGPNSLLALKSMARQACTYGVAKTPPPILLQRWRADLELALYFVLADTYLQARGAIASRAGPGSHPIGKLLPGTSRLGESTNETPEVSCAQIGDD